MAAACGDGSAAAGSLLLGGACDKLQGVHSTAGCQGFVRIYVA